MSRPVPLLLALAVSLPLAAADGDPAPQPVPGETGELTDPPAAEVKTDSESTLELVLKNRFRLGFDSNVPVEPENVVNPSDTESLAWQNRLEVGIQGKISERDKLRGLVTGQFNGYTDVDDLDLGRIGVIGSWQRTGGDWMPHAVLSANHFWLDGEDVLNDVSLYVGAAKLRENRGVWMVAGQLRQLEYDESETLSGTMALGRGGYWFLLDGAGRRVEVDLRAGFYAADEDWESYVTLRPSLIGRWRLEGDQGLMGKQTNLTASLALDWRGYGDDRPGSGETENSVLWTLSLGAGWQFADRWQLGVSASYTERASNIDSRDYDRTRAFTELLFTF